MQKITITEEQKKLLQAGADDRYFELRDEAGELVAQVKIVHQPIPPL